MINNIYRKLHCFMVLCSVLWNKQKVVWIFFLYFAQDCGEQMNALCITRQRNANKNNIIYKQ